MESPEFSLMSSLRGELKSDDYIQPHYKESYRMAIDCLVKDGRDRYHEFLKGERVGNFLSDDELFFISTNAEQPPPPTVTEETNGPSDAPSSTGTYWPMDSDVDTPDLDLGWPEFLPDNLQTNIDLLFHPPRLNHPSIKEVIRKHIQEARKVVAIAMDTFTDVDIFKEVVEASLRGVPVYVLLDQFHLKSFLAMAENQDVKIPQLRNMRVRTVKGQEYLCRSGAKFHGAMEQKFLLVDCHTAIYGSYSFSWSFEKINLSMVQVIKGLLVKLYDEEFRTLYARSSVPAELCVPDGIFQRNGLHGRQMLPASQSGPKIERRDMLRQSLDMVFRKTCEKKLGARDLEERLLEEEPNKIRPLMENGIGVKEQLSHLQSPEMMNHLKRHSYAGERQDAYIPQNLRSRASHWNVSREPNNFPMDNYLQMPQAYRGQNMAPSYNNSDKQVLSAQQNVPTLENTSRSFMRTLRIESYLNNPDVPFGDSMECLDQFEPMDKTASYMQARTRSSFVFRPTMPEQMEANTPLHYTSMQWNPTAAGDHRLNDEFRMKRQSLQILDDNHYDGYGYGAGRTPYQSIYASLGRNKGGHMNPKPDLLGEDWQKRHSLADPRSNAEFPHDPSSHMYGAFARMQINRGPAGFNAQNGGHVTHLNEDQRSVSHYDVQNITKGPAPPNWQQPPARTLSAAALEGNSKDLTGKSNGRTSQNFPKKTVMRINSLLNIPEHKEDSFVTPSLKSAASTSTITAEDEEPPPSRGDKQYQNRTNLTRSSLEHQGSRLRDDLKPPSKPHVASEEHRPTRQLSLPKPSRQKKSVFLEKGTKPGFDSGGFKRTKSVETRMYGRFEPLSSLEKKHSVHGAHTQEKKAEGAAEGNPGRAGRGHHENKLEKFFQRVGNLINKNK